MEPQTPPEQEPDDKPNPIDSIEVPHIEPAVISQRPNPYKKISVILAVLLAVFVAVAAYTVFSSDNKKSTMVQTPKTSSVHSTSSGQQTVQGLQLVQGKDYGNKYSNGILPVGDGKYVTDGAKQGYVYACSGYATNLQNSAGGAGQRGPWFIGTTEYNINKKAHVQGSVMWQAEFSNKLSGSTRTITTNDLPDHPTGVFPISAADPAYAYDRNPNSIKGQTFTYDLSATPSYGDPSCIGGQVGVMLTGVALFSGFDAGGRDAGAWEVQDSCSGHPEKTGTYHYHTLSSCIKDIDIKTVIGFALDGFPITGPKIADNNILTSSDLDACHGITSQIVLDGKAVTSYHYVMTQDFPYSVACYHGKAIQPPGQSNGVPANQSQPPRQ